MTDMKRRPLGQTGILVSPLCFGALTLGPLQRNLPVKEGAYLMDYAWERGVNFFDTSDLYKTYPYLSELVKSHPDAVICSKSYDYAAEGVSARLEKALRGIGRDYIDLFMLHEQESRYTFEGHMEAIEALLKAKKEGKIRAFGISTHRVSGVRDAIDFPQIDVVFPLLPMSGIGIEDGGIDAMLDALKDFRKTGRGAYAMKVLGGGTLIPQREACFAYARDLLNDSLVDSVAVGMQSTDEIDCNLALIKGEVPDPELESRIARQPRELHIDDWCEGCGSCVRRCGQHALRLEDGHAAVDRSKCIACGYCASVCPVFCLKII